MGLTGPYNSIGMETASAMQRNAAALDAIAGGSDSSSRSLSATKPTYMRPDAGKAGSDYRQLQDRVTPNAPQRAAVGVQQSYGQSLKNLLANTRMEGRDRINQGFQGVADREVDRLNSRGTAPEDLAAETAQRGVNRESTLSIGDLMERLLTREVKGEQQVSKSISDLLFGSSDQATDLINALLGSGGIGNISQTASRSMASKLNPPS